MLTVAMSRLPRSLLSMTSQGLVSACNFVISLALLFFAPTQDYVGFLLFVNAFALLSGLQNAIFISPVGVLIPRMLDPQIREVEILTMRVAVLFALTGAPILLFLIPHSESHANAMIAALLTIALVLLLQRDISRNACLVRGDLGELLKFDAFYFITAAAISAIAIKTGAMSFTVGVIAFSLPALMMLSSRPRWKLEHVVFDDLRFKALDRHFWHDVMRNARWAVPGVLVTWLSGNGYWFLLDAVAGSTAVAELGAARLLFTPIGLMIQGWMASFRPVAVNLAHGGKSQVLRQAVRRQVLIGNLAVVMLTLILHAGLSMFPDRIPRSMQSAAVPRFVLLWGAYFAVQWARSGMTMTALATPSGFGTVFKVGLTGCIVFYAVALLGSAWRPVETCLVGLIVAELVMAILLSRKSRE